MTFKISFEINLRGEVPFLSGTVVGGAEGNAEGWGADSTFSTGRKRGKKINKRESISLLGHGSPLIPSHMNT
jgi:hypothetical protein